MPAGFRKIDAELWGEVTYLITIFLINMDIDDTAITAGNQKCHVNNSSTCFYFICVGLFMLQKMAVYEQAFEENDMLLRLQYFVFYCTDSAS